MTWLRGRRARDEGGFTLAELVLATAIEVIIFGALATAFVVVLNSGTTVNENLKRSSDARMAATYIVSDARNSSGPETSLTDTTSCADPTPPVAGTQTAVARFTWTTSTALATTTQNISDYVLVNGSLLRRHCENGVLVNDSVLAASVASAAVACAPAADCSGTPVSVTVTITETADAQATVGSTPYTYSLTAAFRKVISGGTALPPSSPQSLVVFGNAGCGVNVSGDGVVRVYGQAFINTADGHDCNAIALSRSGTFSAGTTSILTGGTCAATGASVCPAVTPYTPAITDPFGSLVPPTSAGPAQTGCTGPAASQTAQPGVYAGKFSIQGANTCTLASGVYYLRSGFSLGNGATVTTAAGGALIYIAGGAFVVGGGASYTSTAMTTGAYANVSVWQAAADTSTISFSNGGTLNFTGAIYAPKAALNISGNAQTPIAKSVVVQTVAVTGSGAIDIGASAVPLSATAAPTPSPSWTVGRAYPAVTFSAAGGDGRYAWSATGVPPGMSFNTNAAVLSGTPTTAGSNTVSIALNDALGDVPATSTFALTITAPPTISLVTLANGKGTAGTIDTGDSVSIVFSSQMAVANFCSTWSGDATDQTLNVPSDVTVTVTNASTDTLTVSSATCTFNFGSLNLGSGVYVTQTATFNGSTSTTRSTIAWDASAHTLLVTLGAKTAGTVASVASSTPVYTAAPALADYAGAALTNSPFTSAAGKKF